MPFTTQMTGTTELSENAKIVYDATFQVEFACTNVLDQVATKKVDICGKQIEFTRYGLIPVADIPLPLAEYDDVASTTYSDTKIIIAPQEYGNAVTTTALTNYYSCNESMLSALKVTAIHCGQTFDKLAQVALSASPNVYTATNAGANKIVAGNAASSLTADAVINYSNISFIYNRMKRACVPFHPLTNSYVMIAHDDVIADLRNSTYWIDVLKYAQPDTILRNEVGMFAGFRVITDSLLTITPNVSGVVDGYKTFFLGDNALGKAVGVGANQNEARKVLASDVDGLGATVFLTNPTDKLARFMNVCWHAFVKYQVINPAGALVVHSASSLGA